MPVVVVNSDTMGRGDAELGSILMGSFLRQLAAQGGVELVLLYNAGVKLACEGSAHLADMKLLERRGVEIVACGTCLGFYELTEKLAVGRKGTMEETVNTIATAQKVVTI